jgi:hypothetical protein
MLGIFGSIYFLGLTTLLPGFLSLLNRFGDSVVMVCPGCVTVSFNSPKKSMSVKK